MKKKGVGKKIGKAIAVVLAALIIPAEELVKFFQRRAAKRAA